MRFHRRVVFVSLMLGWAGCQAGGASEPNPAVQEPPAKNDPAPTPVPSPSSSPTAAGKKVLIYSGDGAWADEVHSLESIMSSHSVPYTEVTSAQVNTLTASDYAGYSLILWPGGDGTSMLNSLSGNTRKLIMNAVIQQGVNYLGFCAGAFLAVSPAPTSGSAPVFFSIIQAPELDYYYLENQGTYDAMTLETFADGSQRSILWAGGPVTSNISGGIVAKYPTGDPAVSQTWSGKGFVLISGVHPAAPLVDIQQYGATSADLDIAWNFVQAALTGTPLPTF